MVVLEGGCIVDQHTDGANLCFGFLHQAKQIFPAGEAMVYGPFPAMMERRSGRTRWYLLAQADTRSLLHRHLDGWVPNLKNLPAARKVRWSVDVDPQDY